MPERPQISIVVPVYNAEAHLERLTAAIARELTWCEYELILVNDGSTDQSWAVIERLSDAAPHVVGVNLTRNSGQQAATLAGMRMVRHPVIVTMDDDLQHHPQDIRPLVEKLAEGHDVVFGVPAAPQHGLLRNLMTKLTKHAIRVTLGLRSSLETSSFRAIDGAIAATIRDYPGYYVDVDAILSWTTKSFVSTPVPHYKRESGRSNYGFVKLAEYTLNMITQFTTLPLRFIFFLGLLATLFGFGIMVVLAANYFAGGGRVPGFLFLASMIAIFSGTQIFAIAVIGEYLGKIHAASTGRPGAIVRSVTRARDAS